MPGQPPGFSLRRMSLSPIQRTWCRALASIAGGLLIGFAVAYVSLFGPGPLPLLAAILGVALIVGAWLVARLTGKKKTRRHWRRASIRFFNDG